MRTFFFRSFVPVDTDPAEPVEDAFDGVLDVPLLIGVVNPEQKLAAVMSGEQPVEEGRSNSANVQEARRTRCESGAYSHGFFVKSAPAARKLAPWRNTAWGRSR